MSMGRSVRAGAGSNPGVNHGALWRTTALVAVSTVLAVQPGVADDLFWNPGTPQGNRSIEPDDGIWSNGGGNENWTEDGDITNQDFANGDTVTFTDPGGSAIVVTVDTDVSPDAINIEGDGYTFIGSNDIASGASPLTFNLSGGVTVNVDTGLSGDFEVAGSGARLIFGGTSDNLGDVTVGFEATFETTVDASIGGVLTNNGTVRVQSGTLTVDSIEETDGDVTIANAGAIVVTTGPLGNSGTLVIDGEATAGSVRNRDVAGASLTITGTVNGAVANRRDAFVEGTVGNFIENRGADANLRITGALTAPSLTNTEGATLNIQSAGVLDLDPGEVLSSDVDSSLVISGRVNAEVESVGTLDMNGNGVTTGILDGRLTTLSTATLAGRITGDLRNFGGDILLDGNLDVGGIVRNFGPLTINNGFALNAIGGTVNNRERSDLNVNGTLNGSIENFDEAIIDVGNNGIITGDVLNDGTVTLAGEIQGAITNNTNIDPDTELGGLSVDGVATVEGAVVNTGEIIVRTDQAGLETHQLSLEGGIAQDGILTVEADTILDLDGAVDAANRTLTNNGTLTVEGTINADEVINTLGNTLTMTGQINGDVTNNADADVAGLINGDLTNSGADADLNVTGDLTAGAVVNTAGARINVEAGTSTISSLTNNTGSTVVIDADTQLDVTNTVQNDARIVVRGTLDANVNSSDDLVLDADGVITGNVTNSAAATVEGTIGGELTNNGVGVVMVDGDLAIGAGITNANDLTVNGGDVTVAQDVTNTGTILLQNGDVTVTAGVTNDGTITIDNGEQLAAGGLVTNRLDAVINANGVLAANVRNDQGAELDVGVNAIIDGDLTNNGDTNLGGDVTGFVTNNSDADDGGLTVDDDATVSGLVLNNGAMTVDADVTLTADSSVDNDNDLNVNGTIVGDVDSSGELDVATGGSITGNLTNSGDATIAGTISGTVINESGAVVTADGGAFIGDVTNDGDFNVLADTAVTGNFTNAGTVRGDTSGALALTVSERFVNTGTIVNSGIAGVTGLFTITANQIVNAQNLDGTFELIGDVLNIGTVDYTGVNTIDGSLTNEGVVTVTDGSLELGDNFLTNTVDGDFDINAGGSVTTTGTVTNAGDFDVAATGSLSGGAIVNQDGGVLTSAGTLIGPLTNQDGAVLTSTGTLDGDLTNDEGGTATVAGDVNGDVTSGGALDIEGTVSGNVTTQTTGVTTVTGDLTTGLATNRGTLNVAGVTLDGNVTNAEGGVLTSVGTITGNLTNRGDADLEGTVDGRIVNQDAGVLATTGDLTTTVLENDATVTINALDTLTADVTNTGTLDITDQGSVTGDVTSSGIVQLDGSINGTLEATAGSVSVDGASSATNVTNSTADFVIEDTGSLAVGGTFTNLADGVITADGDLLGNLTNAGVAALNTDFSGDLANTGQVTAAGDVTGAVTNTGVDATLAIAGDLAGGLTNSAGTVSVATDVTGDLSNADSGVVLIGGDVTGDITNTGALSDLTVDGAVVGAVSNGGLLTLGSTVTGDVTNTGDLTLGGTVTGDLFSDGGGALVIADGVGVTGEFRADSDLSIAAGEGFTAGTFVNAVNGRVGLDGTLNASTTNRSVITFGNAGNHSGDLNNTDVGVLQLVDGARIDGNLINDGSFLLSVPEPDFAEAFELPNVTGETVTIDGDLIAGAGGSFTLDVDLSNGTGDSDRIVVLGAATGDFVINLNVLDPTSLGEQDDDLVLIDVNDALGDANDFDFRLGNTLPASERFVYLLNRADGGTGDVVLTDSLNPALGALAGNVALTQSLIGSVVNRPTSPFVVGLGVDDGRPCGVGGWTRATGGLATASGATITSDGLSSTSEIDATYYGVQFGGDFACFQGHFSGWDLAFGAIGGANLGRTEQPVFALDASGAITGAQLSTTTADFRQLYGGVYVTATRGPLAVDLQLRQEETDFTLSNTSVSGGAGLGLTDTEFSSSATTLSGAVSYAFALQNGWAVAPTAGFAFSTTSTDTIVFDDGATLQIDDSERQIGFVGGTVSKSVVGKDGRSLLSYFASGTLYEDFADPVRTVFTPVEGGATTSFSDNLDAYGEISIGVSYIRILTPKQGGRAPRQFSASARADARFSGSLSGASISAQARWQF